MARLIIAATLSLPLPPPPPPEPVEQADFGFVATGFAVYSAPQHGFGDSELTFVEEGDA
jgi:hypothetical protein